MIIVNNIKHVLEQDKFSGFELMLFLLSGGFGGGKQVIVEPHRHEGKPLEHLHHFRVPHRPHMCTSETSQVLLAGVPGGFLKVLLLSPTY